MVAKKSTKKKVSKKSTKKVDDVIEMDAKELMSDEARAKLESEKMDEVNDNVVVAVVLPEVTEELKKVPSDMDVWIRDKGMLLLRRGHSTKSILSRCLAAAGNDVSYTEFMSQMKEKESFIVGRGTNRNNPEPIMEMIKKAWEYRSPK